MKRDEERPWLAPGEVAAIFQCDPKTIVRYSAPQPSVNREIFHPRRTLGGHRRYSRIEVEQVRRQYQGKPLRPLT